MPSKKSKQKIIEDNDVNYSSEEYWNKRYKTEEKYCWYFNFSELEVLIMPCLQHANNILEIGCGDSTLAVDLWRKCEEVNISLDEIIAFDISEDAIQQNINSNTIPGIQFIKMDARSLNFEDGYFDFCIDKGTIDAMLCDKSKGINNVRMIFSETFRVMKSPGKFMLISHISPTSDNFQSVLSDCIYPAILDRGNMLTWKIDAHCRSDNGSATVYVFSSIPRPITRSRMNSNIEIDNIIFKIHEY
jgi:ubiquinone/menaquinone biosynthesis C-methylase UbiE